MAILGGMGKQGILSLTVSGAAVLHKHYMPFIENGGLFIPTAKEYKIGDEVFLLLNLEEEERLPVTGKVIWITPRGSQGSKKQGIGVQLSDSSDMDQVRNRIDTMLAPYKGEDIPTETM
ncbi:PilZ domain-containing protein [Marinicella sp. W31]|uniref:PilZ domain-containing protein n=1 Tax=Marinicella sp. W31 TaxID=3023713 RepID=UPI003757ED1A